MTDKSVLPQSMDPAKTDSVFAIVDEDNKVALSIGTNGLARFNVDPNSMPDASIKEVKLASEVVRKLGSGNNPSDRMPVEPDGWRSTQGQLYFNTSVFGHAWTALPGMRTKIVKGINNSGAGLSFRRRSGLNIRGRQFRGTYDVKAAGVESKTYKGEFQQADTFPPTGTFAVGDYYRYITNGARTINGESFNYGDLIAYDGTVWKKQPLPNAATYEAEGGDWWSVSNGGYFDGILYAANERIYFVGTQANATLRRRRFVKGTTANGEYYYRGEFAPADGLPTAAVDGEVYAASADGTAGGLIFKANDMLVREAGVWGVVPTSEVVNAAQGAFVVLSCTANCNEWEVRRTDKTNGRVTGMLNVYRQTARKLQNQSSIVFWGDSMPGTLLKPGVLKPFTDAGYTCTVNTYGGGTSTHVLEMMRYAILQGTDVNKDWVHVFWHGQNNDNNAFYPTVPQMLELIAAWQSNRYVLFSVLGERLATSFDGSRLVFATQEGMQAKTPGSRNDIIEFYKATYPDNWFNTRQQLLDAADSTPCLDFPGMTERQVADTYGIPPLSHWFDFSTVTWKPSEMVFKGWHSTSGLPTGGANKDYYVRSGGGRLGNIIVNEGGTWVEYAHDVTHENLTGATIIANGLKKFLDAKGW
ncbi:hypothetical protein [Paenibacillus cineris]|uniref:hypothetical protein n=1 Tax=Paenibacillus cineris TaxID=237530 RepID=UPI001BB4503A|nr:hypothetical protein [Paenibacillus cineris]